MSRQVVLDATAFDVLGTKRGDDLRRLIRNAVEGRDEVCCAAVTLAEVCRGPGRTRSVEAALARRYGVGRIEVVPTDERLAKLVGPGTRRTFGRWPRRFLELASSSATLSGYRRSGKRRRQLIARSTAVTAASASRKGGMSAKARKRRSV